MATQSLAALWDIENCGVDPKVLDPIIRGFVTRNMPDVEIKRFAAYGNTNVVHKYAEECQKCEIPLVDVKGGKNSADMRIVLEMFKFAIDVPPRAYIMLISGDSDFVEAFKCLSKKGYTTILIYPEGRVSPAWKNVADYSFSLDKLIKGELSEDCKGGLEHKPIVGNEMRQANKVMFWDIKAYPLPSQEVLDSTDNQSMHQHQYVSAHVAWKCYIQRLDKVYAFGDELTFPTQQERAAMGIEYIATKECDLNKTRSVSNMMLVQILSVAFDIKAAGGSGDFLVFTLKEELSNALYFLRDRKLRITVAMPSGSELTNRLRNACTRSIDWPKWDTKTIDKQGETKRGRNKKTRVTGGSSNMETDENS